MTDERPDTLSSEGAARREAMLLELSETQIRVHRVRRIRRRVATASCLALVMIAAVRVMPLFAPETHQEIKSTTIRYVKIDDPQFKTTSPVPDSSSTRRSNSVCAFERIKTDPAILARTAAGSRRGVVRFDRLSDDDLLKALAAINRPAGLIRIAGEVRLSAAVTDREMEARGSRSGPGGGRLRG